MKFQTNLNIHCRHILIKYAPALSEVVYRPLEVVVGALKRLTSMLYVLKKRKRKRKIEQCHKLLVVLGVGLAPTRSYSERWQVTRIRLWPWCSVQRA